jgi:hypothetical protein
LSQAGMVGEQGFYPGVIVCEYCSEQRWQGASHVEVNWSGLSRPGTFSGPFEHGGSGPNESHHGAN